jgi:hypothetical protein
MLIGEANHYEPLRVPIPFEHASGSAAHQVLAAVFVDDGLYSSAVFRKGAGSVTSRSTIRYAAMRTSILHFIRALK